MAPPGTITLTNPLTGTFQVAYTRRTGGNIPVDSAIDLLPYRRTVEAGEKIVWVSTLETAARIFQSVARVTGETQWQRASEAAIATVATLESVQPIYLWRKQPGAGILDGDGVQISYGTDSPVLTVLRLPSGEICLYVPPAQSNVVEFRQTKITPAIDPDSEILVELAASIPVIAKLLLRTPQGIWEAAIAVSTALSAQAIAGQDFVRWSPSTEWHPVDGLSEPFSQGTGLASQQYQNVSLGSLHPLALILTLVPNLGVAGAKIRGRFGATPAPIFYAASSPVRLRLQDAAGWFWETTLPTTGGQFQLRELNWSDFLLSSSQQVGGVLPLAPNQQGAIQQYEIVATQLATTVSIQYIGASPTRLSSVVVPTEWAIAPQGSTSHTLQVGNVVLASAPAPPYRITRRDLQVLPSGRTFRGTSLTWLQRTGDESVHQFLVDAQDHYNKETGLLGPFRLSYRWSADGIPGFVDQDDLYDLEWGGWQAKTGAIACREWYETGSAVAKTAAERWLNFLNNEWGKGEAVILDRFAPLPHRSDVFDGSVAAWYVEAALYGNIAGGDRLATYQLLTKSIALLLRSDFDTSLPEEAGKGAIATIHAAVKLLRHQAEVRYPTPSETGNLDSEFATKIAKIMAFQPALNLPKQNAYGFRFRIPFSLENLETPTTRLTTDSTNYTIDTTRFTIDTTSPTL